MRAELTSTDLRHFGLLMGGVIGTLFGLLLPWLFGRAWPLWPWILSGAFWFVALLAPTILKPVYRGWLAFGHGAGWVNTRLILGLVFFLIFTPVGLGMRLFGRDPMRRKLQPSLKSYRIAREHPPAPTDLERPF